MKAKISTNYRGLIVESVFKQRMALVYHYRIKEPGGVFNDIDIRDFFELPSEFMYLLPLARNTFVSEAYRKWRRENTDASTNGSVRKL